MSHLLIIFDIYDNKNIQMFQLLIELAYLYATRIATIVGQIGTHSLFHLWNGVVFFVSKFCEDVQPISLSLHNCR